MEGINLTPPQEIKRRRTQYVVGTSTKLAFLLLLITSGIAVFYFLKVQGIKNEISNLDRQKADLVARRETMKEVEGYAQKLSGKYFLLQKYLESRLKYSSVMLEMLARIPEGVTFDNVGFEGIGKRTRISGSSKDVISVSYFVSQLSKQGNVSESSSISLTGKNAFTDVRLDSLSVHEGTKVSYSISFNINEEAFLK